MRSHERLADCDLFCAVDVRLRPVRCALGTSGDDRGQRCTGAKAMIGFGDDPSIIAERAAFDPGSKRNVSRDSETGAVGDLDVIIHAVKLEGVAQLTGDPKRTVDEQTVVGIGGGIGRKRSAGRVKLPMTDQAGLGAGAVIAGNAEQGADENEQRRRGYANNSRSLHKDFG